MAAPEQPDSTVPERDTADGFGATRSWGNSSPTLTGPLDQTLPERAGRYQVIGEIARGGMGIVYRAYDPDIQRPLALKVLLDSGGNSPLERRFFEEAKLTGQLQHPGIPPVHEIGSLEDGRPFFAMKLIEGRTLAELLKQRTAPADDLPRFLGIFGQICQALAYTHSHGVIHRDLKPANVMVGAFGEVQVMDWGLAKRLKIDDCQFPIDVDRQTPIENHQSEVTQAGSIMGTPAFMPPEQALGAIDQLDERCDVFGLGAILCVILTGEAPYRGRTVSDVVIQASQGQLGDCHQRLDNCGADGELIRLAKSCLEPERERRPRNAEELAQAIERYQAGVQERLRTAELERARAEVKSAEERKRRRMTAGLAAAVILLLTLAGIGAWRLERRASERSSEVTRTREGFEDALKQATALGEQARWRDAETAINLAVSRLGDDPPDDLAERARQARADLRLVKQLDEARQHRTTLVAGQADTTGSTEGFTAAFLDQGLDILHGDEDDLIKRLSASEVKMHLVEILDEWNGLEKKNPVFLQRLARLASGVDQDASRTQLREGNIRANTAELLELAEKVDLDRLTVPLAERLGKAVEKNGGDGIKIMRRMWDRQPRDFWLNFALGMAIERRRGRAHEAAGYFQAALAIRPDNLAAGNNLGLSLLRAGSFTAAQAQFQSLLVLHPRHALLQLNLATVLAEMGEKNEAIAAHRQALVFDPKFSRAACGIGIIHLEYDDYPAALEAFREALAIDPGSAFAQTFFGFAQLSSKDLKGALASQEKALSLNPQLVQAHIHKGLTLLAAKDLDGALASGKRAIEIDPFDPAAHNALGTILFESKDSDGALTAYRRAIELSPHFAPAHYNAGVMLRHRKDRAGALAEFRKATELNPRYTLAWTNLGVMLKENGDIAGAVDAQRHATGADPRSALAWSNLADVLIVSKDLAAAEEAVKQLRLLEPNGPYAPGLLGQLRLAQGKFAEAREQFCKSSERCKPGEPLLGITAAFAKSAERLEAGERALTALDRGEKPRLSAIEELGVAEVCFRYRQRPLFAVQAYSRALFDPALAREFWRTGERVEATRAAVQTSMGVSDAVRLAEAERSKWRKQALTWLRSDFEEWSKMASTEPANARRTLARWQKEKDFAAVREAKSLESLPEMDRAEWRRFWDEVAATLKQLGG
jgi:tetratricopeptide (TPR) repeat protein